MVTMETYEWADLIDDSDKIKLLADPTSTYAQAAAAAISRSMDDEIIAAATGSGFGTVSHWGLFDAASSGNLLVHGSFSASKTIASGDVLKIAVGDLDITAA